MNDAARTNFLVYYLQSLKERSRQESSGTKFGIDWVIYNLAIQEGWTPHRLPFLRSGGDETSKTKTEAEFGNDESYLSPDRKTLRVFVLKDEILNNKNWTKHDFDTDLRSASAPRLTTPELKNVEVVEVILAYNKDENASGIELYERRIQSQGTKVGDNVRLKFERWNLTTIVERVESRLLSPALLPQKFFSQFSYICSQVADFDHGSDEWKNQVIPNWRSFLDGLFAGNADERSVRLLPVALIILKDSADKRETAETGWIDLIEWGMLAIWEVARKTETKGIRNLVAHTWIDFYVKELERYYHDNIEYLCVEKSLDRGCSEMLVGTAVSGVVAHWHLARLGLLSLACAEAMPRETDDQREVGFRLLHQLASWTAGLIDANVSTLRPLVDLNHIELFLTWQVFRRVGRRQDLHVWLTMLVNQLSMRRAGTGQLPFIEGNNSMELVFEAIAECEAPPEYCETSSVYLTCLLELVCESQFQDASDLAAVIYRRLVLGCADDHKQIDGCQPIELMMWFPPSDWEQHVLTECLANTGSCFTISYGQPWDEPMTETAEIVAEVERFVRASREAVPITLPSVVPASAITLACLKHRTPLIPEYWRRLAFPPSTPMEEPASTESS